MNCMKCGKETNGTNVFCDPCLAEMDHYPIKPGTKVLIPTRPEPVEGRHLRVKKERTPEEQINALHKLVHFLLIVVSCLVTTLALTMSLLFYTLVDAAEPAEQTSPVGRNYSTSTPADGE